MKGRPGDYWHQALDRLSLPDRLANQSDGIRRARARPCGAAGCRVAHDQALAALGAVTGSSRDATLAFYRFPRPSP